MRPPHPDNDVGAALIVLATFAPEPMYVGEVAARMWPRGHRPTEWIRLGSDSARCAARARDLRCATTAVHELLLQKLAERDPDLGDGWARVAPAGLELVRSWGAHP